MWLSIEDAFWVRDGGVCPILLALGPHLAGLCMPVHVTSVCELMCVPIILTKRTVFPWCPPSP